MIYHTAHNYTSKDDDENRRNAFAKYTWMCLDNWNLSPYTMLGDPNSSDFGDTAPVPYIKRIINKTADIIQDDDIIFYSNSDICLVPETPIHLLDKMADTDFCYCSRVDFEVIDRPKSVIDLWGKHKFCGIDSFAFRKRWWRCIEPGFPDFVIGREVWDHVMSILMKMQNPDCELKTPLTYHKIHSSYWSRNITVNPGQKHNRRLGRQWLKSRNLPVYYDV